MSDVQEMLVDINGALQATQTGVLQITQRKTISRVTDPRLHVHGVSKNLHMLFFNNSTVKKQFDFYDFWYTTSS